MQTTTDRAARAVRWSGATAFARHYLEMVAAMLLGMAALGISALVVDLPDRTGVELVEMAVWMTVPMVLWMRRRGHAWRECTEMSAAMAVPTALALVALVTGTVTDGHALLMFEHTAMFPAMLAVMLLRRDVYREHAHHAAAIPTA